MKLLDHVTIKMTNGSYDGHVHEIFAFGTFMALEN